VVARARSRIFLCDVEDFLSAAHDPGATYTPCASILLPFLSFDTGRTVPLVDGTAFQAFVIERAIWGHRREDRPRNWEGDMDVFSFFSPLWTNEVTLV